MKKKLLFLLCMVAGSASAGDATAESKEDRTENAWVAEGVGLGLAYVTPDAQLVSNAEPERKRVHANMQSCPATNKAKEWQREEQEAVQNAVESGNVRHMKDVLMIYPTNVYLAEYIAAHEGSGLSSASKGPKSNLFSIVKNSAIGLGSSIGLATSKAINGIGQLVSPTPAQ